MVLDQTQIFINRLLVSPLWCSSEGGFEKVFPQQGYGRVAYGEEHGRPLSTASFCKGLRVLWIPALKAAGPEPGIGSSHCPDWDGRQPSPCGACRSICF